jgi:hypothetical protein
MNLKASRNNHRGAPTSLGTMALLLLAAGAARGQTQLSPAQITAESQSRVAAFDVLSGDYGLSGGSYQGQNDAKISVSKFGGMGDIGIGELGGPAPLGNTGIAWQPRLQGSMGYSTIDRTYYQNTSVTVNGTTYNLDKDENKYQTFAIQFGGGARFWFNDSLSFTPTIMGMYGNTRNTYYVNGSGLTPSDCTTLKNAGLIGWRVDTWTIRPAGELSYIYTLGRTIFTLSSDGTYYYTESFSSSNPNFSVSSPSECWENKLDVDVPLGVEVFGHELRTGGYFSRTEFYGDLKDGLNAGHMYEAHGRLTLDFLGQLWKVQWLGLGYSYLWGDNFHGFTYGADVAFRF